MIFKQTPEEGGVNCGLSSHQGEGQQCVVDPTWSEGMSEGEANKRFRHSITRACLSGHPLSHLKRFLRTFYSKKSRCPLKVQTRETARFDLPFTEYLGRMVLRLYPNFQVFLNAIVFSLVFPVVC